MKKKYEEEFEEEEIDEAEYFWNYDESKIPYNTDECDWEYDEYDALDLILEANPCEGCEFFEKEPYLDENGEECYPCDGCPVIQY